MIKRLINILIALAAILIVWAVLYRDRRGRYTGETVEVQQASAGILPPPAPDAKRLFDITVALVSIFLLSPVFAILMIAIKLTSPGPIFYRAMRVGKSGKLFGLLKFRTMVMNADKIGPAVTGANDPRITPVGRILRRTKLDELPQLFNVLWGDMSIVGPRPEAPCYVSLYDASQRRVLAVRPGITSPASVAFRNEEAILQGDNWEYFYIKEVMPAKLTIDLAYVQKVSLKHDLKIIADTAIALFH